MAKQTQDWYSGSYRSGVDARFYPDGIAIGGWYDSMVGIEAGFITWAEIDEWRKKARRRHPYRPTTEMTA